MPNTRVELCFDGTRYRGWQRQTSSETTIQGKLEHFLSRYCHEPIHVIGCSRTDAGVHAEQYVLNFHSKAEVHHASLLQSADEFLPDDIVLTSVAPCAERFHARFHCLYKTYSYRITRKSKANPFIRLYRYACSEDLDMASMHQAATLLEGSHDFRCFTTQKPDKKATTRHIFSISIEEHPDELWLQFSGDGFLWNMVRILAGSLLEIGMEPGKLALLPQYLDTQNRLIAASMLPAQGLTLQNVSFEPYALSPSKTSSRV